jgi:2-polyprenyl-3-methyl-5-hydroxy-6-metoxy-1,4-benzoquinol methylase
MPPRTPKEIIEEHFRKGDMLGAFEAIYKNAKEHAGIIPWDAQAPSRLLTEWVKQNPLDSKGKRALVVGCGLGDDADFLNKQGFDVTAFDISPTAINMCLSRWLFTPIEFVVADVLNLPQAWQGAFDLVMESRTIQALPWEYTEQVIANISACVKPKGHLLVICSGRDPQDSKQGIPWALSTSELQLFTQHGLTEVSFDDIKTHARHFRVVYRR